MKSYYEHLNTMKNILGESETIKSSKKFTFLTDDLKILSFKQNSNSNKVEKKDNNDKVEIKKLIKYAKSAKTGKVIKDHLSLGSTHEVGSQNIQINPTNQMTIRQTSNTSNTSITNSNLNSLRNNIENTLIPSSQVEKGNTIQIVKNEILNSVYINDIIKKKREGLNSCLKEFDVPSMEDYEKILMRNITTQKISQHTSVMPKSKEDKNDNGLKKDFPDILKEKYNNKQVQWKIEDIQQENMEKLEKERRKETKMFLNQIKKRPRFAQQFIDQYSQRDNKINNQILDINKLLGKQFYDKKKLNRKIDDFIYDFERREMEEEEEKLRNSVQEIPPESQTANHEIKKLLQKKNLLDEQEQQTEVEFGKRENEIIYQLVNDGREKEKSPSERKVEIFQEFQKFKSKVIKREESRVNVIGSKEDESKRNINMGRRESKIKDLSYSNILRKSSEEIIGTLRRNSLNFSKIPLFRKISFGSQLTPGKRERFHLLNKFYLKCLF